MAEFEIKISSMKSAVEAEKNIISKLSSASREIGECRNALNTSVSKGYTAVKRNLNGLEGQVRLNSSKVSSMATALSSIYGTYNSAETQVYGTKIGHAKVADVKNLKSDLTDIVSSIMGEFGFVGKTASLITKALNGDLDGKGLAFGFLKTIEKAAGAVANHCAPNGPGWARAILGDKAKAPTKATKAVKWAGKAMTVAENVYDNYEEFKDVGGFSNKRFWEEAILETGFDLLLAAGVAALVPASAPLWVGLAVGSAAACVTWGVDKVVEHFTGKKLKEAVSDGLIDGAKYASNAISSVGNAVSSAWNRITTPWKTAFSGAW